MNQTQACLSFEQLHRLMECELAAADVAEAEEHLSACEHCRAQLDRAIGNADWWQEARESLSRGAGDPSVAGEGKSAHSDVLALLGPTDDPQMLGRIGTYEITCILGRGGMGVVFKGFDGALNRYVAIKMLAPHLAASGGARKRFAREAQAAAAVIHDNVMAIHSVSEWQGVPYLVMPYGRGISLQRRLSDQGPLAVREILRIGMQTAEGLAAAHAQGLVHRDVKPANILLGQDVERVTLTDFGLARAVDDASLTRHGTLAGTPQYMSPEQARAKSVDARSDLFSLGSVLYAMCTGRSPFRADSSYGVLRLITDEEPTPIREINPEIPEWLCAIVSRLMAKRPEDRFSSASEVAELLQSCLAHVQQPTDAALPSSLSKSKGVSSFRGYKQLFAGGIAMVSTLVLGLAAVLAWQGTAPPISGDWTGEDWGFVLLEAKQPGQYEGTYKDTDQARSGSLKLKWSRVERRFNGTWEQADEQSGKISLRLVGDEIRGAWTTGKSGSKSMGTARLADLSWKRSSENTAQNAILEVIVDKVLRYRFKMTPGSDPEWQKVSRADVSKHLRDNQTIVIHFRETVPYEWVQEIVDSASQRLNVNVKVVRKDSEVTVISNPSVASVDKKIPGVNSATPPRTVGNPPRGKILLVESERKLAWINLGTGDSIKLGMRFEVRATAANSAKDRARILKGSVEVTRILGQHMSEVRILKEDSEDKLTAVDDVIGIEAGVPSGSSGSMTAEGRPQAGPMPGGTPIGNRDSDDSRRLVFPDGWYAMLRGSPRTSASHINSIAYSANGRLIAAASSRPLVEILDADTGKIVTTLKLTTDAEDSLLAATSRVPHFEIGAVAFSLDGDVAAVGTSVGQVKLFNARTGDLVRSLNDEPEKLADTGNSEKFKSLSRALGSVASLAFSPDGRLLAMCGGSMADVPLNLDAFSGSVPSKTGPGRLKVFEVATGRIKFDLIGYSQANAVAFSNGGDLLASAGSWEDIREKGNGVILWNPRNGEKVRAITIDVIGETNSVVFSLADERLLAIGSQRFDKERGRRTGVVSLANMGSDLLEWQQTVPGSARPVAFLPGGKRVAVLCEQRAIKFLDTATGTVKHEIQAADFVQGGRWTHFAMALNRPRMAIGGVDKEKNGRVELWEFGDAARPAEPVDDKAKGAGRQQGAQTDAARNLQALMTALLGYQFDPRHGRVPTAVVMGKDGKGKVPHSWRVEILPLLGEQALYDEYHFDEPWDSEHNRTLIARMPAVFRSPLDKPDSTSASYFALVTPGLQPRRASDASSAGGLSGGKADPGSDKIAQNYDHGTAFSNPAGTTSRDMIDGISNVVVLVEARREIPWTRPEDIPYFADKPLPELGGWFSQGWHAGFADGKVKLLSTDNDEITIRHLFTIGDGQSTEPKFVSTTPETNVAPESLQGVWELVVPPDIEKEQPEVERHRLVFAGDWFGTFRGLQRNSASRVRVEPQHTPQRISDLDFGFGWPMRGIYEVDEDVLQLSIVPESEVLPTKFGAEHRKFKRVQGKRADEQLSALKQHAEQAAKPDTPTQAAAKSEWGSVTNGLRARVVPVLSSMSEDAIDLGQRVMRFENAEDVAFVVELENVSGKPVKLLDTRNGEGFEEAQGKANSDWFGQFLFSIDLFDQHGKQIERPEVRIVELDIGGDTPDNPKRLRYWAGSGALVTTVAPGKAHRILLRPAKWLSPLTQRIQAGQYHAVVSYRGVRVRLAEGDWPADEAVVSSKVPFELSSAGDDPQGTGSTQPALVWGKPTAGVRAALEFMAPHTTFAHGERPELKLHVQNVSDKTITLSSLLWLWNAPVAVKAESGDAPKVTSVSKNEWNLVTRVTLKPQQVIIFDAGNVALAVAPERMGRFESVTHRQLFAPTGKYTMQVAGRFGVSNDLKHGDSKVLAPLEGEWIGELQTGAAPLTIVAAPPQPTMRHPVQFSNGVTEIQPAQRSRR